VKERALQTKVMKYLKQHGGVWVNTSPGPYSAVGIPDILGCYRGQFVAIELKSPERGKHVWELLSPAQLLMLDAIDKNDGWSTACNDMAGVIHLLSLIDKHIAENDLQRIHENCN